MKITEKELRKIIREAVKNKLLSLKEGNDFTAKRQIINAAKNTSMSFETEIIKLLDLVQPDELPPDVQEKYYAVVQMMEQEFISTVTKAVEHLSMFPRNTNDHGGNK